MAKHSTFSVRLETDLVKSLNDQAEGSILTRSQIVSLIIRHFFELPGEERDRIVMQYVKGNKSV